MKIDAKYFYFRLNEWHHLYTGIILIGASLFAPLHNPLASLILWTIGWVLVIDDIGQHILQGRGNFGPSYHSPMHYAGKPLYILRRLLIKAFPDAKFLNKL